MHDPLDIKKQNQLKLYTVDILETLFFVLWEQF